MPTLDFETDAFLTLLTDALRRGPGSPEWREAVMKVKALGPGEANDEMRLLVLAREHLASGKEYRTISAGPEFTRELLSKIDEETPDGGTRKKRSVAVWVGGISAALVVLALVVLAYQTYTAPAPADAVERLKNAYFVRTIADVALDGDSAKKLGAGGPLALEGRQGVRVAGRPAFEAASGEVVWLRESLPATGMVAVEAKLDVRMPTGDVLVQFFVTAKPDFAGATMASPAEIVWQLQGEQAKIFTTDGRMAAQAAAPGRKEMTVRIRLDDRTAVVESAGQVIWAGPHGLPTGQRFVGVRFIRAGKDVGDVRVKSVSVITP